MIPEDVQFLMSVISPWLAWLALNKLNLEVCLPYHHGATAMHQFSKPNSKSKAGNFLQSLSIMIQDLWCGLMSRNCDSVPHTLPKRWSSAQLSKAPGRLKPMSHLQFARQQKNCTGESSGKELKRSELEDMVREGVCLDGTYLAFADLSYAFLSNGRFRGSNLAGANMARAIVIGGNFMDANLRNACLTSADLRHCNFHYADLSGANLRGANLTGADLSGANLWGADLYGANLEGALLAGSNWNNPNV